MCHFQLMKVEEWYGHYVNPSTKSCQYFWQFQYVGMLPRLLTSKTYYIDILLVGMSTLNVSYVFGT
jgi:hypothetical protein